MGDGSSLPQAAAGPTKAAACPALAPTTSTPSATTSVTDHDNSKEKESKAKCPITGQEICPNVKLTRGKDGYHNVPHPPFWPVLGSIPSIDVKQTIKSITELADTYGRFYMMSGAGHDFYICGSYEISKVLNDESRFQKTVHLPLEHLRPLVGDALFTAYPGEPNWDIAHRVLVPVFGPLSLKKMQPMMVDVLAQMLMHWEHTAGTPFSAADQFTRLTLDTIALCGFRFRFNSFHSERLHPFVDSMVACLLMSDERSRWPAPLLKLRWNHNRKYNANVKYMFDLCDKLIAERRKNPYPDAGDMLNVMLHDKDPKTGKHLSDENIRMQIITFLIAGHETTSGMLSFTMFFLLKNLRVLAKAREEADRLVAEAGDNMLNINPSKATYIDWVLKESLRLQPTAPAYAVEPFKQDEPLPGDFCLRKGDHCFVFLPLLHRDPAVWEKPEEFYPERWEHLSDLDPAAYRPFGNGARACIGRGFAIMEGIICLIMILHRFDLKLEDPNYELVIKETLTIKPDNMRIIATPRHSRSQSLLTELAQGSTLAAGAPKAGEKKRRAMKTDNASGVPINILYGSNAGTCATLANEMAEEASARGLKPFVGELDDTCGDGMLPSDGATVVIVPSYEGMPPDNARSFVTALETAGPMPNASFMVLGLGHPDWTTTFHRIPKLVDKRLEELGAQRLMPITLADASQDVMGEFEAFSALVWEQLGVADVEGQTAAVLEDVTVLPASANSNHADGFGFGSVVEQRTIFPATDSHPWTVHTVVKLPEGHEYQVGDYLCVLPKNPPATVERALRVSGLHPDDVLKWGSLTVRAADLFTSYVELGHTAPRTLLKGMDYESARARHYTVLDLMEDTQLPLDAMLAALPRMKARHYSISSPPSPENTATITYTVHTAKGPSGEVLGVCSNYLARLQPGERLQCATKSSPGFHLPPPQVPIAMFAAGSGIAPFMGFIAQRARTGGRMTLWFGCRSAADLPYAAELLQYAQNGLDLRLCLSRSDDTSFEGLPVFHGYVQDRVRAEKEDFLAMVDTGAQFFVCGSSNRLGSGLKKALIEVLGERSGNGEKDMEALSRGRYKTDVFL
ncbi:cytochrome P450 [Trichosporon asahii var. asahii CBS 2479]|uniref:Cytochrome P450 n=1 Tax=Trichosporon asahii var. asahii (strain ATCC 90039 / CBS 2479 / JCM 2466 / KCTC 7840 / NBRC 103889/ NCYC 2677 / UAMH 7654) TaxID=1186058 RepID=J6F3E1_TRIAS|nr:cytochrome P450 [Trichosporon asahii var. asahii CBS 2479]EJT49752.1 cytochrome P450 [Trichosporon asahii var. asahii CBS 2479]